MRLRRTHQSNDTRGSALIAVIVFITIIASLGGSLLQANLGIGRSRQTIGTEQQAFFAADAGMNEAYVHLMTGLAQPVIGGTVDIGTQANPKLFAGSQYWASITRLDFRRFSVVATGIEDNSQRQQETILSYAPDGLFQYGAFGGNGVIVAANSVFDSYDSILGSHASQIQGGTDYARTNAVVGSNDDIRLFSNTRIYGDAHPGPFGAVTESGSGHLVTGSRSPAPELIVLPPITTPAAVSLGSMTALANTTLGPGLVGYDDVSVEGASTLTIVGPAQIVMENFNLDGGCTLEFDTTNGPVKVYSARDWVMQSNSTMVTNSDSAVDVQIFLSGSTDPGPDRASIGLSSNGALSGAFYAPNASISLPSNFEIYGAVMAGQLSLASNSLIHFDEALLYDGNEMDREFVTLLWRPLGR